MVNVGKNKIMGVVSQYEMKYLSKNEWREFGKKEGVQVSEIECFFEWRDEGGA